jgi:tRNA threonylcarbamoyladenosine biosynthesis protein TsaE
MEKSEVFLSIEINQLSELSSAATLILNTCKGHKIFAFHGEMGAGKTTFARVFCEALGSKDWVSSPSFSIVNEYNYSNNEGSGKIYHFDLYRLGSMEEALQMGVLSYLESGDYCLIEWPELISAMLPEDTIKISFTATEIESRKLQVVPFFSQL